MSTIVCQGLPSFLDSPLIELTTLRLKLASPGPHLSHSLDSDSKILFKENGDPIKHKFSNPSTETSSKTQQDAYVHPLVERASSVLSDKSLEICTENLGSETGTDIIEDEKNIFSADSSSRKIISRKTHLASSRRMSPRKTFPPPLSTMMGSEAIQVKSIRENGRLILMAVKVQPRLRCFQADRSNGRVRLRLVDGENSYSSDHPSPCD